MNEPATPSAPARSHARPTEAAQLQQFLVRHIFHAILFVCGNCAWVFKLKGDGSSEGGLLPYSPLQVLIPLLGMAALPCLLARYRGLPPLVAPKLSAAWLALGMALIIAGAAQHLRGGIAKEAALYMVRWLLPAGFLVFYTVSRSTGAAPLALLLGLVCGACVSAVSVAAVQYLGAPLPVSLPIVSRWSGYLNHPNQYGILCSTTAPVILYLYHSRRRLLRCTAPLLLPVYLLCLYQNLSKTNIVLFFFALFIGSLALALKNPRKLVGTIGLALGLAIFLACTVGFALDALRDVSPKAEKTLEDALFNPSEAKSVDSRAEVWETAVRSIKAHPITGLGPGQAFNVLGLDHAHNLLLQLYLDAGLPGFLGACLVILGVFWRAAELLRAEIFARGEITDERMLRLLSSLATVIYILANSMSDSFSTATMPSFLFFAVLAFSPESDGQPQTLISSRRAGDGLRRSPHAGRLTSADAV